jgi:O-acetyl-ADP-ribose deacetylase (regulator of RNase III)
MKAKINKVTLQVTEGDLFSLKVAAPVHDTTTDLALPPRLLAAGFELQREIAEIGFCAVGSAVITTAGSLPFEKIIHTAGPRWGEGSERGKLMSATYECLLLAETYQLRSIAFPAISTGAMGYPIENCAKTMITQVIDYTYEGLRFLKTIIFCPHDPIAAAVFRAELREQAGAAGAGATGA